ncbi:MAG: hypothetical protein B7X09_04270, partial [Acidiphilium sp. 21-66-27]
MGLIASLGMGSLALLGPGVFLLALALAVTLVQAFLLARTEPLGLGVVPLVQPILLALAQALLVLGAQLILGAGLVLGAGTAGGERGEAGRGEHENGAAGRAERS